MKNSVKILYLYFFLVIAIINFKRIQAQLAKTDNGCKLAITNSNLIVFNIADEKHVYSARVKVPHNISVAYKCRQKFALQGPNMNTCIDGVWQIEHPTCIRYCPSEDLITRATINAVCEYNDERISCNQTLLPGTSARIICKIGYVLPKKRIKEVLFCGLDGRWDSLPFSCEPVCGTEPIQTRPFIFDGTKINSTMVPWHAAIYSLDSNALKYRCGGTIISERVILTAAHCFAENYFSEKLLDYILFTIAIGKSYREITADEPITPHFFNLTEIFIPLLGLNRSNIRTNIALAVLDGTIKFNMFVKPICIEWQSLENRLVASNLTGRIAGFGYYKHMEDTNELRVADLPTLSYDDCKYDFNTLTYDTFCINTNGKQHVCAGDSGSGFFIPKTYNGIKRYYLWGVLTNANSDIPCCSSSKTAVATNIQFYSTDINQIISEYDIK